ncbi:MAG: hypothetical protein IT453_21115 [Planctomycetes bacterium]|nr:hypothetical protein [Planctomycetota bacterium]
MRRLIGALLLATVGFGACERVEITSEQTTTTFEKGSSVDLTLLQKIVDAPSTVSWMGRRRFEAHYSYQGAPNQIVYEETVITDGTGRFQLRAEDLITPVVPANEEALFLLSQDNREGLMFRHRDPTVRDAALFLKNYTAIDAGVVESIAGRSCARWTVHGNAGGNTWTIWIDLATGVILKNEERDGGQVLISLVEYLDFTDAPDTVNAVWHTSPLQESPLVLSQAKAQLGFDPLKPKLLPANFRLLHCERVVEPIDSRTWARFTYSDGWATLMSMDGGEMPSPQPAQQGIAPGADLLRFLEVGPWAIADGRVAGRRVLAAVRGNETLLKLLVESSVQ